MQSGPIRLAVVDADSGFVRVLAKRIQDLSWQFHTSATPLPIERLVAMRLNALIVDPTLLGQEAWAFLERLTGQVPGLGLIVCSAQSTVAQRVRGLRLGADDWVSKPCHPDELIARIESVVRRRRRALSRPEAEPLLAGELELRADQYQAVIDGHGLDLTRRQFELLQLLIEARGQVLQREEIYQRVWGYAMVHGERSVDVIVGKLRQALEAQSPDWEYIHTHFGIGYRLEPRRKPRDVQHSPAARTTAQRPLTEQTQSTRGVPSPADLVPST